MYRVCIFFFFFSSRRRHTRFDCDWSSDVCSSDLSGVAGAWRGCRPDADHRRAGRRAPAGRHHRLRERAPREAPGTRLTRRAATLAGGRQAARVTWGTCLVGSCLILEPTRHDGGPMARTLLSALAVIALFACGGAKEPASHSRTHAAEA